MNQEIGIITEQNDLGLGFDPLNEQDQKAYNESIQKSNDEKEEKKDVHTT